MRSVQSCIHAIDMFAYPVAVKNGDLEYLDCNKAFEKFVGKSRTELLGKKDDELFHQTWIEILRKAEVESLRYGSFRQERSVTLDGHTFHDTILYVNRIEDGDTILGVVISLIDITELKTINDTLAEDRDIVTSILDSQSNLIAVTDGVIVKNINQAMLDFLVISSLAEFNDLYYCLSELFEPHEGFYRFEAGKSQTGNWVEDLLTLKAKDRIVAMKCPTSQALTYFAVNINLLPQQKKLYVISFDDITELQIKSENFQYEANHDSLTTAYNKNYFQTYLPSIIKKHQEAKKELAVMMFDIDHFKYINDTYGHLVGDKILQELSQLVKSHIRAEDLFVRWGGEEFIVILKGSSLEGALDHAQELKEKIADKEFASVKQVTCSFGVVRLLEGEAIDRLLSRLDLQLYQAKKQGRNCVCVDRS